MIQVTFLELKVANKDKVACDILEKLFINGRRIIVYASESKHTHLLDNLLWTWKQDSFIPHAVMDDSAEDPIEPVLLTSNMPSGNETDVLVLYDPLHADLLAEYKTVIDFAEVYHQEKLLESRKRYKTLRDDKRFELHFAPLGAFLNNSNS